MFHPVLRTVGWTACLGLGAIAAGFAGPRLLDARGAVGPTLLEASSVNGALVTTIVMLVLAAAAGILMGRLVNGAAGLFGSGLVIGCVAWRCADSSAWARVGGSPLGLAVECALAAVLTGILAWIVLRLVPLRDVEPTESGRRPSAVASPEAAKMLGAALVAIPVAWLLARSVATGQTIFAATAAGVAAGLAGRLASPHVQPVAAFVGVPLTGAVGAVVSALLLLEGRTPLEALRAGELPALVSVMPLDWAAGALLGVPMGLGWARSFLHHEDVPTGSAAAAGRA